MFIVQDGGGDGEDENPSFSTASKRKQLSKVFFLPVLAMKKEEQELLELSEGKERENETPEKESDAQDFLEDEFDREFWVEVRCVRFKSFVYMLMFSYI